jgi:hypothetical protein
MISTSGDVTVGGVPRPASPHTGVQRWRALLACPRTEAPDALRPKVACVATGNALSRRELRVPPLRASPSQRRLRPCRACHARENAVIRMLGDLLRRRDSAGAASGMVGGANPVRLHRKRHCSTRVHRYQVPGMAFRP